MSKRSRLSSDGTLEGFKETFPDLEFRSITQRKFKYGWIKVCKHALKSCIECHAWRLRCICGIQKWSCKTHGPTVMCDCGIRRKDCTTHNSNYYCIKCKQKKRQKSRHCIRCHPDYVAAKKGVSKIGCKFIDELERDIGLSIRHSHLDTKSKSWIGDEFRPSTWKQKPVDGLIEGYNVIVEFLGDEFHGHPNRKGETNMYGELYTDLFEETQRIFDKLYLDLDYEVWYVWESDYKHKSTFTSVSAITREYRGFLEYE